MHSSHRIQEQHRKRYCNSDTNDTHVESKIENTIPCTIAPRKMKFLSIHFPKQVRDPYAANYKMLMKEIKVELINEETYLVHGLDDSI